MSKTLSIALVVLICLLSGIVGMGCFTVVSAIYADHQLLNTIRANDDRIRQQQVEEIRQFQQQQQQQAQQQGSPQPK